MRMTRLCVVATIAVAALWTQAPVAAAQPNQPSPDEVAFGENITELMALPAEKQMPVLVRMAREADNDFGDRLLKVSPQAGKLRPPDIMVSKKYGWEPGGDFILTPERLFGGDESYREKCNLALYTWMLIMHLAPEEGLRLMQPRLAVKKPNVADLMHLVAVTGRQPGQRLSKRVPKELWRQFYNSPNPCYKILALEKYDSTDQTPGEILKLYRECLFNTFTYLQVRALEGIYDTKDYRPEVKKLVEEFLASNPPKDDGTKPAFVFRLRDPVWGARVVLNEMSGRDPLDGLRSDTPVVGAPDPVDAARYELEKQFHNTVEQFDRVPAKHQDREAVRLARLFDLLVGPGAVKVSPFPGKLSPPDVLVGLSQGWVSVSQCDLISARLFPEDAARRVAFEHAVRAWCGVMSVSTRSGLEAMMHRLGSSTPSVVDLVHLFSSMRNTPGLMLFTLTPRDVWQKFYDSPNPCHKILALETFDSTDPPPTPDELLKLYRECLFNSFGYLQVRALEGISIMKDYRPEVRDLLQEFINSNPAVDDGTLPHFQTQTFHDPVSGAKKLLEEMTK